MRVTPTLVLTFCAKTQKIDSHFSLKDILTSKLILTFHFKIYFHFSCTVISGSSSCVFFVVTPPEVAKHLEEKGVVGLLGWGCWGGAGGSWRICCVGWRVMGGMGSWRRPPRHHPLKLYSWLLETTHFTPPSHFLAVYFFKGCNLDLTFRL